jgi:hypothetical protein
MLRKNLLAVVLALPLTAAAQSQDQLIERYTELAGSEENAASLVKGLREGKEVTLVNGDTIETFIPPTGNMGWGNVDNTIAIAERLLKDQGITDPTPAQLEAAVTDVLKLRADGMGWGEITQTYGFKLGEVKGAGKPSTVANEARAGKAHAMAKPERVATFERPVRPEKPERPVRPERPERPERPQGKGR